MSNFFSREFLRKKGAETVGQMTIYLMTFGRKDQEGQVVDPLLLSRE